jgi:uncharacterized membrane protein
MSLPFPLHPVIVHMPIALTILVPAFAVGAIWAIKKGVRFRRAWSLAVGMLALLVFSGWIALQTGQNEEEKVEDVVGEQAIETHEEAAEAFLLASGIVLLIAGAGFVQGRSGVIARGVATVGTFTLVGMGYNVGHSGGNLVYREGAATAYTTQAGPTSIRRSERPQRREEDGEHERSR